MILIIYVSLETEKCDNLSRINFFVLGASKIKKYRKMVTITVLIVTSVERSFWGTSVLS